MILGHCTGTGTGHGLPLPLFNATVISMNKYRYKNACAVLRPIGFKVVRKTPNHVKTDDAALRAAFRELPAYRHMDYNSMIDQHRKTFSNYLAFHEAISSFAQDASMPSSSWRFYFEDDIALFPGATNASATADILQGIRIAEANGYDHIWLGVCAPSEFECTQVYEENFAGCQGGKCAHAFGVRKSLAATLPDALAKVLAMWTSGNDMLRVYFDVAMYYYTRHVRKSLVVRYKAESPQAADHVGLFYQDRKRFETSIA